MSKSLLYHYFESKEAILHDLLADHVHALVAASEAAIAGSDEARAQFRALVHAHMRLYAAARARHVLLLNALDDLPSRQREEVVALERRLLAIVGGLLERLRPDLMADPARRRPYVMSFYGLINWTHTWYRPDGPLAPEAFAELAADLFLDGFCRAAMPPG
jgi:AcrR family transcriptional regulator